ncbi:MAG: hypothetical protein QOJ73_301 [Streptosporangiaceae bacterium]|jgi:hypothetical protein|nr:hypothetical protein [Streptosporangiaceae bacterium]
MNRPPPQHRTRPATEPTAAAVVPAVATGAADAVRIFNEDVRSAVSYERGLAVKALLALALVAAVVAARVLFLG